MFTRNKIAHVMAGATRAALLAIALIVLAGAAHAEQKSQRPAEPSPAAMKIAREIIELKNAAVLFGPMVPGVIERVKNMLLQTSPALRKDLDDVSNNLQKTYAPRTNELLNDIAWLYATRFSEAELKEIVTFYRTPTGKRVIAEEPIVFDDAMNGLKSWQEKFAEEVIVRFRAEMKKRGHELL
ncbi:MAG: DUF2059 domain-containing protein [Rhizobiales bacterium]|nr:DUF2059 domain-containing protein [Hyphomicrobiales bacterium]